MKKRSKSDELDRKEWFFVEIAKPEMKAAFIYEHARELAQRSPATIDLIMKAGRTLVLRKARGRIHYEKLMRDHIPDFVRISQDRFPRQPWQALDDDVRFKLIEA